MYIQYSQRVPVKSQSLRLWQITEISLSERWSTTSYITSGIFFKIMKYLIWFLFKNTTSLWIFKFSYAQTSWISKAFYQNAIKKNNKLDVSRKYTSTSIVLRISSFIWNWTPGFPIDFTRNILSRNPLVLEILKTIFPLENPICFNTQTLWKTQNSLVIAT